MRTRGSRTILTASAGFIRPSAAALPVIPLLLAQKTAARWSLIRTGEAEIERKKTKHRSVRRFNQDVSGLRPPAPPDVWKRDFFFFETAFFLQLLGSEKTR